MNFKYVFLCLMRIYLNSLPGLPGLDALVEHVLDGAHDADVVVNKLRQQEVIILKLIWKLNRYAI